MYSIANTQTKSACFVDLVEGPLDALKQTSDHSCSTTSVTSMAGTLPSESDVEDGLIPWPRWHW